MTSAAWELVREMLGAVAFLLLLAVTWAQSNEIRALKARVKRIDEKLMERMDEP